jgi:hypothetical protein
MLAKVQIHNSQPKPYHHMPLEHNNKSHIRKQPRGETGILDLVDVLVLELDVVAALLAVLGPVDVDALVEPERLGELPVGLEQTRLVVHVLEDDVGLVVLVVAEADEDDVARRDPDLLVHLATDVAETARAVDADGLAAAIAEHAGHLRVLLPVLLEDELALVVVRLVLTPLPVLASLTLVLRHLGGGGGGGRRDETLGVRDRGGGKVAVWLAGRGIAVRWVRRRVYSGEARGRGDEGSELLDLGLGVMDRWDREGGVGFWISGGSGGHAESWQRKRVRVPYGLCFEGSLLAIFFVVDKLLQFLYLKKQTVFLPFKFWSVM